MENLKVKVGENEYDITFSNQEDTFFLNGKTYKIEELRKINSSVKSASVNNQVFTYGFYTKNESNKVRLNNFDFDTIVRTQQIAEFEKHMQVKSAANNKGAMIKAPMPGLVVKIDCQIGALVKKGDKLLSIEAMKMENAITSPVAGEIISIKVTAGDTVEKDKLLIEIQ
jgi:biotin carboxyl carrier protein